jgi:hypothetical protein
MLSVWGVARRRCCCRTELADVLPRCTHLYAVTFSCWLYSVFCSTGATHIWFSGYRNASCGPWPHDVLWGKAFLFFNSSLVTAGQTLSCCVVTCLAVWWRHRVVQWLFYYVVSAYCLARHVTLQGRPHVGCQVSFFTEFSSAVVATCLFVTLVGNENRCSEDHIVLAGVTYILPCFSTRSVRSGYLSREFSKLYCVTEYIHARLLCDVGDMWCKRSAFYVLNICKFDAIRRHAFPMGVNETALRRVLWNQPNDVLCSASQSNSTCSPAPHSSGYLRLFTVPLRRMWVVLCCILLYVARLGIVMLTSITTIPFFRHTDWLTHCQWTRQYKLRSLSAASIKSFYFRYLHIVDTCIRRFRKIAKSDCQLRQVSLSVCRHETTRLPLDEFSWNLMFQYFFQNL